MPGSGGPYSYWQLHQSLQQLTSSWSMGPLVVLPLDDTPGIIVQEIQISNMIVKILG